MELQNPQMDAQAQDTGISKPILPHLYHLCAALADLLVFGFGSSFSCAALSAPCSSDAHPRHYMQRQNRYVASMLFVLFLSSACHFARPTGFSRSRVGAFYTESVLYQAEVLQPCDGGSTQRSDDSAPRISRLPTKPKVAYAGPYG